MMDTVDFDSFSKVLNRPGGFRDPGEPEEYCRGFQVFDKDMTGFIGVGQLRYSESELRSDAERRCRDTLLTRIDPVLTNLGEKMSDDEVDELLKAVDTSSGEINYTGKCSSKLSSRSCLLTGCRSRANDPSKLASVLKMNICEHALVGAGMECCFGVR